MEITSQDIAPSLNRHEHFSIRLAIGYSLRISMVKFDVTIFVDEVMTDASPWPSILSGYEKLESVTYKFPFCGSNAMA